MGEITTHPAGWLDGIGPKICPTACSVDKCMITGENVCGHPRKGGLQPKFQHNKAAIDRHGEALAAINKGAAP